MIFHRVEAIYYTQKRISNGSVWMDGELGKGDRIYFLESLKEKGNTQDSAWALASSFRSAQGGWQRTCWGQPAGCRPGVPPVPVPHLDAIEANLEGRRLHVSAGFG